MTTRLFVPIALAATIGLSGAAFAGDSIDGPRDAIGKNLGKNGAFEEINDTAIDNGQVVFGGKDAINSINGGVPEAAVENSPVVGNQSNGAWEGEALRVEPKGVYDDTQP